MYKYILTTSFWLESLAKKEIIKLWYEIIEVHDKMIIFSWPIDAMIRVNLWSRVWNKLYMILASKDDISDFDSLYDLVFDIKRRDYIKNFSPIIVKAKSIKSELYSTPSIQKITKKAIVDKLTKKSWEFLREDDSLEDIWIQVLIIENKAYILLDTSWEALHKRWYRKEAWDAPIKENLAAWLVLLSFWKFSENFYDIFCWSWTIAIEAAMIAKNIAPWLNRNFAFESFKFSPIWLLEKEKKIAREKQFDWKYNIIASDINEEILEIARENAKNAKLGDSICFIKKDMKDYLWEKMNWTLVSNPPYWLRLKSDNLDKMYQDINLLFSKNKEFNWWIITSYLKFNSKNYKNRKLYNWSELAYFYIKKFKVS